MICMMSLLFPTVIIYNTIDSRAINAEENILVEISYNLCYFKSLIFFLNPPEDEVKDYVRVLYYSKNKNCLPLWTD